MGIEIRNINNRDDLAVVAGIRSPVLDMPAVEEPELDSYDFSWVTTNTWLLPYVVRPALRCFLASLATGKPVLHTGESSYYDTTRSGPSALLKNIESGDQRECTTRAQTITKLRDRTRVAKTADGFRVSLCVAADNLTRWVTDHDGNMLLTDNKRHGELLEGLAPGDRDKQALLQRQHYNEVWDRLVKVLGADAIVPEKALDIRLDPSEVFSENPAFNAQILAQMYKFIYGADEYGADLESNIEILTSVIKSVRLIASPTSGRNNLRVYDRVYDQATGATQVIEVNTVDDALAMLKAGKAAYYYRWVENVLESRTWYTHIDIDLPAAYAQYIVQASVDDVSEVDVLDWVQQWYHYQDSNDSVSTLTRLTDVNRINQELGKKGIVPKTRCNSQGLTIHPDGFLMLIPDAGDEDLSDYHSQMITNRDLDDGELCYNNPKYENLRWHEGAVGEDYVLARSNRVTPANKLLLVDWYNCKLSYTNTSGVQTVLDLERCTPVNETHIAKILDTTVYGDGNKGDTVWPMLTSAVKKVKDTGVSLDGIFTTADPEATKQLEQVLNRYYYQDFMSLLEAGDLEQAVSTLWSGLLSTSRGRTSGIAADTFNQQFPWFEENADNVKLHQFDPATGLPWLKQIGVVIRQCADTLLNSLISDMLVEHSVLTGLKELGLLTVVHSYLGDYKQIKAVDAEMRKAYLDPVVAGADFEPKGIALVKDLTYQPHQARIQDFLTNSPQLSVLSVAAGGGKTIQILTNILYELEKGNVKRPLVLCPAHLVRDYVKEANSITGGRLNMIAVTTASVKSWGDEALIKLVKNSPPNTIVVSNYDFLSNRMVRQAYGRSQLNISLNCELLRMMDLDGAWLDEVHYLRNVNQRSIGVGRLMAEIPFKRVASGTLIVDTMLDIANEFSFLDPTVFGTQDQFVAQYGRYVGGKMVPNPGAEVQVNQMMKQYAMVLTAGRREWAALLPPRVEKIHFVELSDAQRAIYESILEETIERIKEEDPELYRMLMAGADDEDSNALEGLLGPYLARLEQFLTSPGEDAASIVLPDSDKVSPKAVYIEKIIRQHLDSGTPGKILIFTEYAKSVKTIFEQLPPDLQAQTIYYTAKNKFKCADEFTKDPEKRIMVGIGTSMNTGLNLQVASRLIRVESVWSPGVLEQGESRINRPSKQMIETGVDGRTNIFFDWVIVNRSIDVTKMGRLIGKLVSMNKFENPYDGRYQRLPDLGMLSMSLPSIMANNDYNDTLGDHLSGFNQLRKAQELDYQEYRNDPRIDKTFKPVADGQVLPGSALLTDMPYVDGMDLYGAQDLGILDWYSYEREFPQEAVDPTGLVCHTEWGDGEVLGQTYTKEYELADKLDVTGPTGDHLTITIVSNTQFLKDGKATDFVALGKRASVDPLGHGYTQVMVGRVAYTIDAVRTRTVPAVPGGKLRVRVGEFKPFTVDKMKAFIVTKKSVSTKSVRQQLAKLAGLSLANPMELEGDDGTQESPVDVETDVESAAPWELVMSKDGFNVFDMGDYYCVTEQDDPTVVDGADTHITVIETDAGWIFYPTTSGDGSEGVAAATKTSKGAIKQAIAWAQLPHDEEEVEVEYEGHSPVPQVDDSPDGAISLDLGVSNGGWLINANAEDKDVGAAQLKQFGFRLFSKAYYYVEVVRAAQLRALIDMMAAKFEVPASYMADLESVYELFSHGRNKLLAPDAASKAEFRTFFMDKSRRPTDPDTIKPYVDITAWDGVPTCYVIVDANCPAAAKLKAKIRIPGLAWVKETNPWLARYCQTKGEVKEVVDDIRNAGIEIENLADFKAVWKAMKPIRRSN